MTYRELLAKLQAMTPERLDDDATVYDSSVDEYHPVNEMQVADESNGVLDVGHRFLTFNFWVKTDDEPDL